jgi:hypothetical protein
MNVLVIKIGVVPLGRKSVGSTRTIVNEKDAFGGGCGDVGGLRTELCYG